jgi:hypothetical protein
LVLFLWRTLPCNKRQETKISLLAMWWYSEKAAI